MHPEPLMVMGYLITERVLVSAIVGGCAVVFILMQETAENCETKKTKNNKKKA